MCSAARSAAKAPRARYKPSRPPASNTTHQTNTCTNTHRELSPHMHLVSQRPTQHTRMPLTAANTCTSPRHNGQCIFDCNAWMTNRHARSTTPTIFFHNSQGLQGRPSQRAGCGLPLPQLFALDNYSPLHVEPRGPFSKKTSTSSSAQALDHLCHLCEPYPRVHLTFSPHKQAGSTCVPAQPVKD